MPTIADDPSLYPNQVTDNGEHISVNQGTYYIWELTDSSSFVRKSDAVEYASHPSTDFTSLAPDDYEVGDLLKASDGRIYRLESAGANIQSHWQIADETQPRIYADETARKARTGFTPEVHEIFILEDSDTLYRAGLNPADPTQDTVVGGDPKKPVKKPDALELQSDRVNLLNSNGPYTFPANGEEALEFLVPPANSETPNLNASVVVNGATIERKTKAEAYAVYWHGNKWNYVENSGGAKPVLSPDALELQEDRINLLDEDGPYTCPAKASEVITFLIPPVDYKTPALQSTVLINGILYPRPGVGGGTLSRQIYWDGSNWREVEGQTGLRGLPVATLTDLTGLLASDFELRKVLSTGEEYVFERGAIPSATNPADSANTGAWILQFTSIVTEVAANRIGELVALSPRNPDTGVAYTPAEIVAKGMLPLIGGFRLTNGAKDNPKTARAYPFLVSGNDFLVPSSLNGASFRNLRGLAAAFGTFQNFSTSASGLSISNNKSRIQTRTGSAVWSSNSAVNSMSAADNNWMPNTATFHAWADVLEPHGHTISGGIETRPANYAIQYAVILDTYAARLLITPEMVSQNLTLTIVGGTFNASQPRRLTDTTATVWDGVRNLLIVDLSPGTVLDTAIAASGTVALEGFSPETGIAYLNYLPAGANDTITLTEKIPSESLQTDTYRLIPSAPGPVSSTNVSNTTSGLIPANVTSLTGFIQSQNLPVIPGASVNLAAQVTAETNTTGREIKVVVVAFDAASNTPLTSVNAEHSSASSTHVIYATDQNTSNDFIGTGHLKFIAPASGSIYLRFFPIGTYTVINPAFMEQFVKIDQLSNLTIAASDRILTERRLTVSGASINSETGTMISSSQARIYEQTAVNIVLDLPVGRSLDTYEVRDGANNLVTAGHHVVSSLEGKVIISVSAGGTDYTLNILSTVPASLIDAGLVYERFRYTFDPPLLTSSIATQVELNEDLTKCDYLVVWGWNGGAITSDPIQSARSSSASTPIPIPNARAATPTSFDPALPFSGRGAFSDDGAIIIDFNPAAGQTLQNGTIRVREVGANFVVTHITGHSKIQKPINLPQTVEIKINGASQSPRLLIEEGKTGFVKLPVSSGKEIDTVSAPLATSIAKVVSSPDTVEVTAGGVDINITFTEKTPAISTKLRYQLKTTSQSVGPSSTQQLILTAVGAPYDTPTISSGSLVIQKAGWYSVVANFWVFNLGESGIASGLISSGSGQETQTTRVPLMTALGLNGTAFPVTLGTVYLAAGETLSPRIYQTTGSSKAVSVTLTVSEV